MPFGSSWSVDRLFALKRHILQKGGYAIPVNDVASSMRLVNRGSITSLSDIMPVMCKNGAEWTNLARQQTYVEATKAVMLSL